MTHNHDIKHFSYLEKPGLHLVPLAMVMFRCFLPTVCPGAPEGTTLSVAIIKDHVTIVLWVNLGFVQTFDTCSFTIKICSYLHGDPCSCLSTLPCVRGPGATTSPIIDAKVTVLLHYKPEWLTSLVFCPWCPYWVATWVDDKIAIWLHAEGEPSITTPQPLPMFEHIPTFQKRHDTT